MCYKSSLEIYIEFIQRLEGLGAKLLSFNCPFAACGEELKALCAEPRETCIPLSTCPHCGNFYWKVVQHGRACAVLAQKNTGREAAVPVSCGPLAMPIPNDCSDLFAAGWAFADGFLRNGADLAAEATATWHEEKGDGFWERLAAERNRVTAEVFS